MRISTCRLFVNERAPDREVIHRKQSVSFLDLVIGLIAATCNKIFGYTATVGIHPFIDINFSASTRGYTHKERRGKGQNGIIDSV